MTYDSAVFGNALFVFIIGCFSLFLMSRIVLRTRREQQMLRTSPTITMAAIEEEDSEPLTVAEQADFDAFQLFLSDHGFVLQDLIRVSVTSGSRTFHSIKRSWRSATQDMVANVDRASGIYPAQLTFITTFEQGAQLITTTPWGQHIEAPHYHAHFAYATPNAYAYHQTQIAPLQARYGAVQQVHTLADRERQRQQVFEHYDPSWNQPIVDALAYNGRVWLGGMAIIAVMMVVLLVRVAPQNIVLMIAAALVTLYGCATLSLRRNQRALNLDKALDAADVLPPDIRFPTAVGFSGAPARKKKQA